MENVLLDQATFNKFREFIEKSCAILLGDDKAYLIENRLVGLLASTNSANFQELYEKAAIRHEPGLRDKIIDAMTTNETLWFRDSYPFEILEKVLFPTFVPQLKTSPQKRFRIWCAACSTGQEPYSIAMILQELARTLNLPALTKNIEIVATDISPTVLFLATAGRYDKIALSRGLPEPMRNRYFQQSGTAWAIKDEIRKMVQFKKLNLQESFTALGKFDIIFCRNVLIYFSDAFKQNLIGRFTQTLVPQGHLFLGGAEMIAQYSTAFELMRYNARSYYRLKGTNS